MKAIIPKLLALAAWIMGSWCALCAHETPLVQTIYFGSDHQSPLWTTNGTMDDSSVTILDRKQYIEISGEVLAQCENPVVRIFDGKGLIIYYPYVEYLNDESQWVNAKSYNSVYHSDNYFEYAYIIENNAKSIRIGGRDIVSSMEIWDFGVIRTNTTTPSLFFSVEDFEKSENGCSSYNYDSSAPKIDMVNDVAGLLADVLEIKDIDISKYINPCLFVEKGAYYYDYWQCEVSSDGKNYTRLEVSQIPILPKDTRFIRICAPEFALIAHQTTFFSVAINDLGELGEDTKNGHNYLDLSPIQFIQGYGGTFYHYKNIPNWLSAYAVGNSILWQKIDGRWYRELGSGYLAKSATEIITKYDHQFSYRVSYNTPSKYPSFYTKTGKNIFWYDVDGNGALDAINNADNFYLQYKEGPFTEVSMAESGLVNTDPLAISDFNADGLPDILTSTGVAFGIPGINYGGFKIPSEYNSFCSNDDHFVAADADNDGRTELLYGCSPETQSQNAYLKVNADMEGLSYPLNVFTASNAGFIAGVSGAEASLPSLGNGMFVKDGVASNGAPTTAFSVDITGDGIPEILNDKEILLNYGNGTYLQKGISGDITLRDFNGDGVLDYVGNDTQSMTCTLFLVQQDGQEPKEVKLLSGVMANAEIYCFDFDKDGDVDILIPCDRKHKYHDNGAAYLIVMENRGDGSFKRHENYLEGEIYFHGCLDINADGLYEVVYSHYDESTGISDIKYVSLNSVKGITEPIKVDEIRNRLTYKTEFGNFTTDGHTYFGYGSTWSKVSTKPNTRPTPPAAPKAAYDKASQTLSLSWGDGNDAEASAADLSYAMRIGTTADSQDVMWADALADGTRRNLLEGNMSYSHHRVLDVSSWPKGKYYISVQAIDPNRSGSTFSQATIFDKTENPVDFAISIQEPFRVGDECVVTTNAIGAKFDFGADAEIAYTDAEAGRWVVRYSTAGSKSIRMLNNAGVTKSIEVLPSGINRRTLFCDDQEVGALSGIADLDEDGKYELWGGLRKDIVTTPAASFGYTQIKKIWNTNLPTSNYMPFDFNHDGHADLFEWDRNKLYTITNEEDLDATVGQYALNGEFEAMADVNHDGHLEFFDYDKIGYDAAIAIKTVNRNDLTTSKLGKTFKGQSPLLYDFNNDGFMDFIVRNGSYDNNQYPIYLNCGLENPGQFIESKTVEIKRPITTICDFDNDGQPDFLSVSETDSYIPFVQWSDGEITEFSDINRMHDPVIVDINNDGLYDIYFQGYFVNEAKSSPWTNVIGYQKPGRKFEFHYVDGVADESTMPFIFRDADGYMRNNCGVLTADNEKPQPPTSLRASQNSLGVTIQWDAAHDKESNPYQMSYNVSVKLKGKEGEDAYLISPMNGGKNGVPVPQPYYYTKGTVYQIPLEAIAPGDYEIKVQAMDAWMEASDFSSVLEFTVKSEVTFELQPSTWVGTPTEIKLKSNVTPDVTLDGGTIVERKGSSIFAQWSTVGEKTVSVDNISQKILVIEKPVGDFTIPAGIGKNETRYIQCDNPRDGYWTAFVNGNSDNVNGKFCRLEVSDGKVAFTPLFEGVFTINHVVGDAVGEITYSHDANVTEIAAPTMSIVSIDDATGHFTFTANPSNSLQTGYNVYKETQIADEFAAIVENVSFSQPFVDASSDPSASSVRYMVKAAYADGGESCPSAIHQTVHLMINKGIGNGWNLIWTRYEGLDIASYNVMRGTSPSSLSLVQTLSGNAASWSDTNAPAGTLYYAIEPVVSTAMRTAGRAASEKVLSNVVSTEDAREIVSIDNITVRILEGSEEELSENNPIQFGAYITPANASIRSINWTVENGADLAQINQNGLLTLKPNGAGGTVVVRASAVDGSGIYGEYAVRVISGIDAVDADAKSTSKLVCSPNPADDIVNISSIGANGAEVIVYALSGVICQTAEASYDTITLNVSNYPTGHYFVVAIRPDGTTAKGRFIKR